ncbi:uncharacterized protein N7479_001171 [Penicillium vulpinum]|uniref:Uncharacterized protein n=1 Tax=Penicillium vulpinum TaxID=29845 RepID=A0A1V6R8V1_9EURO|nr:uncharacterized protein N7479_001171 [Penicillium vulpinum]KAJ5971253.1 hypothetical protein N7479_001171 [Penicillium vulpinum]OQD97849.1 hypothetical protein PENVUL_c081G05875 [Penicillium vulpinum]
MPSQSETEKKQNEDSSRDVFMSKLCQGCPQARDECEVSYEGTRGHGFGFWHGNAAGYGVTPNVVFLYENEIASVAAVTSRDFCFAIGSL